MKLNIFVVVHDMTINPGNTMGLNLIHSVLFDEPAGDLDLNTIGRSCGFNLCMMIGCDMASHFCGSTEPKVVGGYVS